MNTKNKKTKGIKTTGAKNRYGWGRGSAGNSGRRVNPDGATLHRFCNKQLLLILSVFYLNNVLCTLLDFFSISHIHIIRSEEVKRLLDVCKISLT